MRRPAPLARCITAASEQDLLDWYRKIREPLKALYSVEDEIALIAWELARWQDGLELIEQQAVILLDSHGPGPSAAGKHSHSPARPGGTVAFASIWRAGF